MTQDWWKVRKGKILANNFIFDCIICMAASPKKNGAHLRTQILNTTGTPTPNQQQSLVLGSDLDSVMAQCSQQLGTVLCPSGQLEGHNQLLRRSRRKFPDLEGEDSLPCYSKSGGNHHQMVNHFANRSPPSVPKRARLATPASSQAKDISNRFQESCGGSSAVIDDAHAMYHSSLSNHIQEHISCQLEVSITHLSQTPNSQAKKRSVENAGNLKTFSDGSSPETGSLDVLQENGFLSSNPTMVKQQKLASIDPPAPGACSEAAEASRNRHLKASRSLANTTGELPSTEFCLNNTDRQAAAGSSVFEFRYKKRPHHDWESFLALHAPGYDKEQDPCELQFAERDYLVDGNLDPPPHFNPLYYLQQFFTPQQVAQFKSQNPGKISGNTPKQQLWQRLQKFRICSLLAFRKNFEFE